VHDLKQLKRLRWAVRAVLTVGVAASVAANILHANPNPISQTIAAWPSLAFLLTVELVSRIPVTRRLRAAVRIFATATVAGIAGWVSYWHMVDVATRYGETGTSPYLLPLTVDGVIVVASVSLIELAVKIAVLMDSPPAPAAPPLAQAQQVVNASSSQMPVPVSPAPVGNPPAAISSVRATVPAGRSGPQVRGPSRTSPLTGRVLMEEPPQA
jgi:hypothetical protein